MLLMLQSAFLILKFIDIILVIIYLM